MDVIELAADSLERLTNRASEDPGDRRCWLSIGFAVGPVTWGPDADGGAILFIAREYAIEWARIDTSVKLVEWCEHLREKNWFDIETLGSFVTVWLEVFRLKATEAAFKAEA